MEYGVAGRKSALLEMTNSDTYPARGSPRTAERLPVRPPLSAAARVVLALWGLALLLGVLLLRTAFPSPLGYGTHQQWGFGPCVWRVLWEMPCPVCGMTTSLTYWFRGDWWRAMRIHPAGPLFGLGMMVQIPWCLMSSWLGRWWGCRSGIPWLTGWLAALFVVTGIHWGIRVWN